MKGHITKEQLSDNLKEYLQTLGLTEEQVNEAINLSVGDKEQLQTNDKTSIVNAINELNNNNSNNTNNLIQLSSKVDGVSNNLNSSISGLNDTINTLQKTKICDDFGNCLNISNGDLNSIASSGFYMGDNVANSPIVGWIYVDVRIHNNLYQVQVATNLHDSSQRWTRHKTGGSWSAWREL